MDRHDSNRRDFMKLASIGVAGAATSTLANHSLAAATSQVRLGLIGCGGRGTSVAEDYNKQPGVRVTHVCDVHQRRRADAARKLHIAPDPHQ